jgi:hypothetical protein
MFSVGAVANAQSVELLPDTQYSTELSTKLSKMVSGPDGFDTITTSKTKNTTASTPLGSALNGGSAKVFAKAKADTFSVSTSTSALPKIEHDETSAFAKATAETVLSFRALQDVTAPLTFDFAGAGQAAFSDGFVSLVDVTAGLSLFSYGWTYPFAGTVPWDCCYHATISLSQWLLSSHLYTLTLHASTNANIDSQSVSISLSGLRQLMAPVPEPELATLMLVGIGMVAAIARRRHGRERRRLS